MADAKKHVVEWILPNGDKIESSFIPRKRERVFLYDCSTGNIVNEMKLCRADVYKVKRIQHLVTTHVTKTEHKHIYTRVVLVVPLIRRVLKLLKKIVTLGA